MLGVGVIALLVRIVFVACLSASGNEKGLNDNAGDARQYIALARNLAEFGTFISDTRPAGTTYYSLLRPPIYPAMVAPFEAREARAALFYVQALIGCAIPMFAVFLSWLWFQSRAGAWLAGVMAALSPTGIGMTGQMMADQLFATLFAASIVAAALAAGASPRASARWLWTAGVICGLATLVKPAGLYWAFVLPVLVWILSQAAATKVQWRHLVIAVVIGLSLPALWAIRNYRVAGVFAVSTVDAQNLRYYLAPQTQEWAAAGEVPSKGKLRRNRDRAMGRDIDDAGKLSPAQIVKRQWAQSFEIFHAHPHETMKAYGANLLNHLRTPFNGFDYQFPEGGWMRQMMARLELITGSAAAYVIMITLSLASLLPALLSSLRHDPTWRSRLIYAAAPVLIFAYVHGLSGTTYGTGARILYPAHIAVQAVMAAGAANLVRVAADVWRSSTNEDAQA